VTKKQRENKKPIAFKDNRLIQLRGQIIRRDLLTAVQQKLVTFSASLVKAEDEAGKRYSMTIKDFADLCGVDKGGKLYLETYREASKLKRLGLDFIDDETGDIVLVSFLEDVRISKKKGTISYKISDSLLPYYRQYSGKFTLINLIDYMPMRGRYALLLYELLLSWKAKGQVYYEVDELRRLLDVPENKYSRTVDFMRRVVNPAVQEINEKSTVFSIKLIEKTGPRNRVEGLTFIITTQAKRQLEVGHKDLLDKLTILGVEETAARALTNTYSRERIMANIELAQKRAGKGTVKNIAGVVCSAIADDYAQVEQAALFPDLALAFGEQAATSTNDDEARRLAKADCPKCGGTGRMSLQVEGTDIVQKIICKCTGLENV